ncbi:MAG TPA: M1 family peptidase, partial [Bacteroidetes bacterium]|nr:M1 family peptidase [Bacteroidota bacterium]
MKKICTALFILLSVSLNPVNSAPLPRMLDQFPGQKTFFTPLDIDADSSHSYDALHLAVELVPDLEGMSFTAEVTMTARIMEDDLETLPMDHLMLTIDSVWVDGENADFSANASSLTITLPEAAAEGDTLSVRVAYHGRIRADNSFGGMMYNEGSDVLFTFGEPYRTRAWIVCYDKPFDKVTSEIAVTMDNSYHVVSNGSLSEVEDVGDDLSRTVWSNDYPISTYLISVCAHPYLVIDLGGAGRNDTPVNLWVYPQDSAAAMSSMGRTPDMIEYFEDRFGPFPFDKYDAAEASIAANMEHQTATTMTEGVIRSGPVNEWVVAHELAHQWWGDMVGPLTFKEIWLNEGLASYSHMLWFGHEDEELFRRGMDQIALAYFQEDRSRRYPIWDPPVRYLFGTAVYYKGAWVLHMLRRKIGDELFFETLRTYLDNPALRYGNVESDDFIAVCNSVTGEDLDSWFHQWLYRIT